MDRRRNSVSIPAPVRLGVPVLPPLVAPVEVKQEEKPVGLKSLHDNHLSLSDKLDALTVKVEALSKRKLCECELVDKKFSSEVTTLKQAIKDLVEN